MYNAQPDRNLNKVLVMNNIPSTPPPTQPSVAVQTPAAPKPNNDDSKKYITDTGFLPSVNFSERSGEPVAQLKPRFSSRDTSFRQAPPSQLPPSQQPPHNSFRPINPDN